MSSIREYKELLDRLYAQLPKRRTHTSRFTPPRVDILNFGNQTVIENFTGFCNALNRNLKFVMKFVLKELGTMGMMKGNNLVLQGDFPPEIIQDVLKTFIKDYVICPVCKRPDTRIVREKRFYFMICDACGAKSSVRAL